MLDDSNESSEAKITRYEIPLKQLIPKKLWEAQQTEYAMMTEDKLMREAVPDTIDWRLRIRFQSLMQKLMDPHNARIAKPIRQEDIFRDICSYEVYKRRVDLPAKAVFIGKRLGSYLEDQDALLTAFSTRLWEIASAPIMKPDGTLDIESAKILHKTIQILLDRKFGQAVQRQVSLLSPANPIMMDPLQIETQLRQLEGLPSGDDEP
jgi:hypothetical protein